MKITGGKHKYRNLTVPKGLELRPTQSKLKESFFNICQGYIEGALFLDLFAGIGSMGCEALSRGAKQVVFVEKERRAVLAIKENIALLKEERNAVILSQDAFIALENLKKRGQSFDIIFADPPYGTLEHSLSNQVLKFIDDSELLKRGGSLFLEDAEMASKTDFPLKTLRLKSERRMGSAFLREYETISVL
jgi:16S rRNA (guanine966-N2)-methyltransferase